jgi:hypothetical protein
MRKQLTVAAALVAVVALVAANGLTGQATLKSGPQVGQQVPGPFHPLNINGAKAGKKNCLYCEHGTSPVAMIFARKVSPGLTTLIKKIDAATVQNKKDRMGSFVVFLSDNEGLADQLKSLAQKENLQKTVLSIDNPAGPKGYNVAKDADVTVVLYEDHTVRFNFAFRDGQLNGQAVNRILADLPKILEVK